MSCLELKMISVLLGNHFTGSAVVPSVFLGCVDLIRRVIGQNMRGNSKLTCHGVVCGIYRYVSYQGLICGISHTLYANDFGRRVCGSGENLCILISVDRCCYV